MQGFGYFGLLGTNGESWIRSLEKQGLFTGLRTMEAGEVTGAMLMDCQGMRNIQII